MNKYLIILFLLIEVAVMAQNKKTHLRNGNDLYADSLFNDAEMKYRKSLEKDQDYFSASYNLADAIYKQERYEESSALFDGLKDNAKDKNELSKIYHNLGNSMFKQQKLEESISAYKNALKNNPTDEDTRHNLAFAQKMLQQQQEQQKQNEENKEKQEDKEKNKEEENKQQQEKQEEKQQQKKEQQPQEKEDMSKETAKKMLEALEQQERELQEKLQKKKVKGKKVKVLKDW